MTRILALIPARGGSKRLPGKNILPLDGRPLIQWSIEAALQAQKSQPMISRVMVSTDDPKIAEVAKAAGAEVPFLRSPELASDTASSLDTVLDVLDQYQTVGEAFDFLLLLQPTSPLRTAEHILKGIQLQAERNADAIVSVTECDHSPLWANQLPPDDSLDNFIPESLKATRSQDLAPYYRLNGAIYLVRIAALREQRAFITRTRAYALKMDKLASVDIDDQLDFLIAQTILRYQS